MFGRAVGRLGLPGGQKTLAALVRQLFANSEQGVWYDPSDLSTMFQDAAGTTPVTGVEQPVGMIRDKSGRGNHATQSTTTSRPVLSARYNGLTSTEDFSIWSTSGSATRTKNTLTVTSNLTDGIFRTAGAFLGTVAIGVQLTVSVELWGSGQIRLGGLGGSGGDVNMTTIDLTSTPTRYSVTYTNPTSGNNIGIIIRSAGSANTVNIDKAQLIVTNALPSNAYQRVTTATDYDSNPALFPYYLRFDGTDDWLKTGDINFTSTDKMTVVAGVRKLSDAAFGALVELGNLSSSSNVFGIAAPAGTSSATYRFRSIGSLAASDGLSPSTFAAPISNVVTGIGDIAGDSAILRVNGAQAASGTTDQGAGTYRNDILYIGRRAGTTLPFNGRLYGLIVRGAASSAAQIAAAERFMAQKTGVTL